MLRRVVLSLSAAALALAEEGEEKRGCCYLKPIFNMGYTFPANYVRYDNYDLETWTMKESDCPDYVWDSKNGALAGGRAKHYTVFEEKSCREFDWFLDPNRVKEPGCCYRDHLRWGFDKGPLIFGWDQKDMGEQECMDHQGSPTWAEGKSCNEFDWYNKYYGEQKGCCWKQESKNDGQGWYTAWGLAGKPGPEDEGYQQMARNCPMGDGGAGMTDVYFAEGKNCQDIPAGRKIWPDEYEPTGEPTLPPTRIGLIKVCNEKKKCACDGDFNYKYKLLKGATATVVMAKAGYKSAEEVLADPKKLMFPPHWNDEYQCTTKSWAKASSSYNNKVKEPNNWYTNEKRACYCLMINPPTPPPTNPPEPTPAPVKPLGCSSINDKKQCKAGNCTWKKGKCSEKGGGGRGRRNRGGRRERRARGGRRGRRRG